MLRRQNIPGKAYQSEAKKADELRRTKAATQAKIAAMKEREKNESLEQNQKELLDLYRRETRTGTIDTIETRSEELLHPETTDTGFMQPSDVSRYDSPDRFNVTSNPLDASQIEAQRAENQPFYAKLGAGFARFGVNAISTLAENSIGFCAGAVKSVEDGSLSGMATNSVTKAINDWSNTMNENLPLYRDAAQQRGDWSGMLSMNTVAETIAMMGYTAGNVMSSVLPTGIFKGLATLAKTANAARTITAAGSLVAGLMAASGEASLEGLNNSEPWKNRELQELSDSHQKIITSLNAILRENPNDRDALIQLANEQDTYEKGVKEIEAKANMMASDIFKMNVPLLWIDNVLQFSKIFGRGMTSTKQLQNNIVRDASGAAKADRSKFGTFIAGAKSPFSEGSEEFLQGAIGRMAGDDYSAQVHNFINGSRDPDAKKEYSSYLKSFGDAFLDKENWQEAVQGAIGGGLGAVSLHKREGHILPGLHMEGGAFNQVKDYLDNWKKEDEMAKKINDYESDPKNEAKIKGGIRHLFLQKEMDESIQKGDKFNAKNLEYEQTCSDIAMYQDAGLLDDYKQKVMMALDTNSIENLKQIKEFSKQPGSENGSDYDDLDLDVDADVEKMRDRVEEKKKKILASIDDYTKRRTDIDVASKGVLSVDQLNTLTWMKGSGEDVNKRIDGIIKNEDFSKGMTSLVTQIQNERDSIANNEDKKSKDRVAQLDSLLKVANLITAGNFKDTKLNKDLKNDFSKLKDYINKNPVVEIEDIDDLIKLSEFKTSAITQFKDLLENPYKMDEMAYQGDEAAAKFNKQKFVNNVVKMLNESTTEEELVERLNALHTEVPMEELENLLQLTAKVGNKVAQKYYHDIEALKRKKKKIRDFAVNEVDGVDEKDIDEIDKENRTFTTQGGIKTIKEQEKDYYDRVSKKIDSREQPAYITEAKKRVPGYENMTRAEISKRGEEQSKYAAEQQENRNEKNQKLQDLKAQVSKLEEENNSAKAFRSGLQKEFASDQKVFGSAPKGRSRKIAKNNVKAQQEQMSARIKRNQKKIDALNKKINYLTQKLKEEKGNAKADKRMEKREGSLAETMHIISLYESEDHAKQNAKENIQNILDKEEDTSDISSEFDGMEEAAKELRESYSIITLPIKDEVVSGTVVNGLTEDRVRKEYDETKKELKDAEQAFLDAQQILLDLIKQYGEKDFNSLFAKARTGGTYEDQEILSILNKEASILLNSKEIIVDRQKKLKVLANKLIGERFVTLDMTVKEGEDINEWLVKNSFVEIDSETITKEGPEVATVSQGKESKPKKKKKKGESASKKEVEGTKVETKTENGITTVTIKHSNGVVETQKVQLPETQSKSVSTNNVEEESEEQIKKRKIATIYENINNSLKELSSLVEKRKNNGDNESIDEYITDIQSQIDLMNNLLNELNNLSDLSDGDVEAESFINEKKDVIKGKKEALIQLKENLEKEKSKADKQTKRLDEQRKLEAKQQELIAIQTKKEKTPGDAAKVESLNSDIKELKDQLSKDNKVLQDQINKTNELFAGLITTISSIQGSIETTFEKLTENLSENVKISEVNAKLAQEKANESTANAKLSGINAKISEANKELAKANEELAKMEARKAEQAKTKAERAAEKSKQSEKGAKKSAKNAKKSEDVASLAEKQAIAAAKTAERLENKIKKEEEVSKARANYLNSKLEKNKKKLEKALKKAEALANEAKKEYEIAKKAQEKIETQIKEINEAVIQAKENARKAEETLTKVTEEKVQAEKAAETAENSRKDAENRAIEASEAAKMSTKDKLLAEAAKAKAEEAANRAEEAAKKAEQASNTIQENKSKEFEIGNRYEIGDVVFVYDDDGNIVPFISKGIFTSEESPFNDETHWIQLGATTTYIISDNKTASAENTDQSEIANAELEKGNKVIIIPAIPELAYEGFSSNEFINFDDAMAAKPNPKDYYAIYKYLTDAGTFKYINEGNLHKGDKITFAIDRKFSQENPYGGYPAILMVVETENGGRQVVGVLSTNEKNKELREEIYKAYKEENSNNSEVGNIFEYKKRPIYVNQVYNGAMPHSADSAEVNNVDREFCDRAKGGKLYFAVAKKTSDNESGNNSYEVVSGGNAKRKGFVHLPKTMTGVNHVYFLAEQADGSAEAIPVMPKSFTAENFGGTVESLKGTKMGSNIIDIIENMLVPSVHSIEEELSNLGQYINLSNFNITKAKDKDGNFFMVVKEYKRDKDGKRIQYVDEKSGTLCFEMGKSFRVQIKENDVEKNTLQFLEAIGFFPHMERSGNSTLPVDIDFERDGYYGYTMMQVEANPDTLNSSAPILSQLIDAGALTTHAEGPIKKSAFFSASEKTYTSSEGETRDEFNGNGASHITWAKDNSGVIVDINTHGINVYMKVPFTDYGENGSKEIDQLDAMEQLHKMVKDGKISKKDSAIVSSVISAFNFAGDERFCTRSSFAIYDNWLETSYEDENGDMHALWLNRGTLETVSSIEGENKDDRSKAIAKLLNNYKDLEETSSETREKLTKELETLDEKKKPEVQSQAPTNITLRKKQTEEAEADTNNWVTDVKGSSYKNKITGRIITKTDAIFEKINIQKEAEAIKAKYDNFEAYWISCKRNKITFTDQQEEEQFWKIAEKAFPTEAEEAHKNYLQEKQEIESQNKSSDSLINWETLDNGSIKNKITNEILYDGDEKYDEIRFGLFGIETKEKNNYSTYEQYKGAEYNTYKNEYTEEDLGFDPMIAYWMSVHAVFPKEVEAEEEYQTWKKNYEENKDEIKRKAKEAKEKEEAERIKKEKEKIYNNQRYSLGNKKYNENTSLWTELDGKIKNETTGLEFDTNSEEGQKILAQKQEKDLYTEYEKKEKGFLDEVKEEAESLTNETKTIEDIKKEHRLGVLINVFANIENKTEKQNEIFAELKKERDKIFNEFNTVFIQEHKGIVFREVTEESSDEDYEKADIGKEFKWLKRVLPQFSKKGRYEIIKGLIEVVGKGPHAWGAFTRSMIQISSVAASGTIPHEAFHALFRTILSDSTRTALYKEIREEFGDITNIEAEEIMAERLRHYIMDERKEMSLKKKMAVTINTIRNEIAEKIEKSIKKEEKNKSKGKFKTFAKNIAFKAVSWHLVKPRLNDIFYNLNKGHYASSQIHEYKESEEVAYRVSKTKQTQRYNEGKPLILQRIKEAVNSGSLTMISTDEIARKLFSLFEYQALDTKKLKKYINQQRKANPGIDYVSLFDGILTNCEQNGDVLKSISDIKESLSKMDFEPDYYIPAIPAKAAFWNFLDKRTQELLSKRQIDALSFNELSIKEKEQIIKCLAI